MLKVIGLTGTNGKTTVSYLLQAVLKKAGYKVAVNGTLTGRMTTPSPWELQELIAKLRGEKYDFLIMEVSSHGIHQDRIKGIQFVAKLLTNITQDHLDYHKTFRAYRAVKMDWMKKGDTIKVYPKDYRKVRIDFKVPLLGEFNYRNFQSTIALARALGIKEAVITSALKAVKPVSGRFEPVPNKKGFTVIVDYAHTPDGLENVLATAKQMLRKQKRKGRLITLFGCGGDRDKGKRPKMGAIARNFSNVIVVTSDNPRSEEPQSIIDQILAGIRCCSLKFLFKRPKVHVEIERHLAIEKAISMARPHDVVMLAGKGHETYQIFKDKRIHFDDREEARKALTAKGLKNKA